MTTYLKLIDGSDPLWPYDPNNLRGENPQVSFPAVITGADLSPWGVYPVDVAEKPTRDKLRQGMNQIGPVLVDDQWRVWWEVYDYPPEVVEQNLAADKASRVPDEITSGQAQAALHMEGLLDDVETIMADPVTDRLVKIAWTKALTFKRSSPMVAAIAGLLGLSSDKVDDLFILGSQIDF